MPAHVRPLIASIALLCAALAGCGTPPGLRPPGTPVPRPSGLPSDTASPTTFPTAFPTQESTAFPTATASVGPSFAEEYAISCNGYPGVTEVIALLRRTGGLLPRTGTIAATTGPLCAGAWQYTVLAVPQHDPMGVVTKGSPKSLTLVTTGTDICSITVRTEAPAGILNAALCAPPGTTN